MESLSLPFPEESIHFSLASEVESLALALADRSKEERPEAILCHDVWGAEKCIQAFSSKGYPLRGAGAVSRDFRGKALPVYIDLQELGAIGANLLLSRITRPNMPVLRIGAQMQCITTPSGNGQID